MNENQYIAAVITSQGCVYSCVLCDFDNGSVLFSAGGAASVNLLLTRFQYAD